MLSRRELLEKARDWPWLITGTATLTGAGIGSYSSHWLRTSRRRKTIRVALHTEIDSMNTPVRLWRQAVFREKEEGSPAPILGSSPFTSKIFEANAGELGLLSATEAEQIGEFYSMASWYDQVLNRFYEKGSLPAHVTLVLLKRLPLIESRLKLSLDHLERNLDTIDKEERSYLSDTSDERLERLVLRHDLDNYQTISPSQGWSYTHS